MRWVPFTLLCILALTIQSALAPRLMLFGARPDWLLLLVVFTAFHASFREAVIGAWIVGLGADLLTIERLGFLALSYTLVAMGISSLREAVFREQLATQLVVTAIASLALRCFWMNYRRYLYGPMAAPGFEDIVVEVLWASLYTAAWMALLYPAQKQLAHALGLTRVPYKFAPLRKKAPKDV